MTVSLGPSLALHVKDAARLGHLAVGTTYVMVGVVALLAALDGGVRAMGSQGALHRLLGGELGRPLLLVIALGLAADFVWQVVRTITNADRAPTGVRGMADRAGWTIGGCVHLGLAVTAVKLALELPQLTAESQTQAATAAVMSRPFGQLALVGTGTVLNFVGLQMFYRVYRRDLDRWLDLRSLYRVVRTTVLGLGLFGLAARGIVFCTGGTILLVAAIERRPWDVRALGGTLREIGGITMGPVVLGAIALGFIAFGLVEILSASYRRINVQ
jgi:hypothetical protein